MSGLMMEDFMEEVPCKLGKGLDFIVEDGCGMRVSDIGTAKWLQQRQ